MKRIGRGAAAARVIAIAAPAAAQVADKPWLTLEGARRVIAAAKAAAGVKSAPGAVIAVVDDGGNLMGLERLDGAVAGAVGVIESPLTLSLVLSVLIVTGAASLGAKRPVLRDAELISEGWATALRGSQS